MADHGGGACLEHVRQAIALDQRGADFPAERRLMHSSSQPSLGHLEGSLGALQGAGDERPDSREQQRADGQSDQPLALQIVEAPPDERLLLLDQCVQRGEELALDRARGDVLGPSLVEPALLGQHGPALDPRDDGFELPVDSLDQCATLRREDQVAQAHERRAGVVAVCLDLVEEAPLPGQ